MRTICLAGAVVLALTLQSPALAHDLGVRGIITAGDGEPANDIPGFGVFGHWRLGDRWSVGVAVDQTEYDFEEPAKLVGLRQDPGIEPVDTIAEGTVLSAWIERTWPRPSGRLEWFWGAGLGFASIDVFEFHRSADVMLMVVIGGVGWLYGDVAGAIVFKLMQDFLSQITPQYWTFWLGLFLVVLVLVGRDRLLKPWTWFRRAA